VKLSFDYGLKPGETINNEQLQEIFKCSSQGGMRRSHKTNTLVIVSDHTKAIYEDRWIDGNFHYTGMGLTGDQRLDFAQNKTLADSKTSGIEVFLFEGFESGKYNLIGQVELADNPYQENQLDRNEQLRKVWVFPLKLTGGENRIYLPEAVINRKQEQIERDARRLSDEELEKRVSLSPKGVGVRETICKTYERNPYVAELAKRRTKGICQLCDSPAPFQDKNGNPFLETHHVEWLSDGGEDTIKNTVALCPNYHRQMHILNKNSDREKLQQKALERF
jgi:5-methylcytosine-specific restriction enzyme A